MAAISSPMIAASTGRSAERWSVSCRRISYTQGRRGWIRLHEKGGKEHDVPLNHALETLLDAYLAAAGIKDDPDGPLFRTVPNRAAQEFTRNPLWHRDAYRMIQRRAKAAGIATHIGNHSFRATGITAYLKNEGLLENVQQIAAHASPRTTTKLYDRRAENITPGEVEKITI
jgi:integrase